MDEREKVALRHVRDDLRGISRRSKDEYLKLRLNRIRARLARLLLEDKENG